MKFGKITGAMALTMAVAGVPAMAINAHSRRANGQYQTQSRQYGDIFTRLDRNGDGVISRSEWPRDAATFDRLDLNHDGVITQAEAQQVFANRQRNGQYGTYDPYGTSGQRFRGMDRNGDGVITRDEWRGNDQSFRNHDRNGDGILSGDELRGNGNGQWKQNKGHGHGKNHAKQDDDEQEQEQERD